MTIQTDYYPVNDKIRARELRVLTNEGENLGVLSLADALGAARQRELDLVVIAPQAAPPVAKILDFKKFLYEERKKKSSIKAKAKKSELKELRFGPTIDTGDLTSRIGRAIEWIKEGNRVKVTVIMKGREGMFPEVAFDRLKRFEEGVGEVGKTEGPAKRNGNQIFITFVGK